MWNSPRLLFATADALFLVGAVLLGMAALHWFSRLPLLPVRYVAVDQEPREVTRSDLERALSGLRGNLYSVSLEGVRQSLQRLPWVRRAEVRRRWPDVLEVTLYEQRAVARWGDGVNQWVNVEGEVFFGIRSDETRNAADFAGLPTFQGPLGTAAVVLAQYQELKTLLAPIDRLPEQVTLTPRLAWEVRLDDGMQMFLGRERERLQVEQRVRRFANAYARTVAVQGVRPQAVDLRYPNGFVMRMASGGALKNNRRGSS